MYELRVHPAAIDEARAARLYYQSLRQALADDFIASFDRATRTIAERPLTLAIGAGGERRCRLQRFPYALVFVVAESQIEILALTHLHRRPGYWRHRRTD